MTIRQSLLAILDQGPNYGYQLRAEFERRTGNVWPVNVGQIYSTLDRLERDGQVRRLGEDAGGHQYFEITNAGRAEVQHWLQTPTIRSRNDRDELSIKLAIAVTLPGVDIARIVQLQRAATLRALQDLTATKHDDGDPGSASELAWSLVVDALIFQAEAEVRWLDHTEARLSRALSAGVGPLGLNAEPVRRGRPARREATR
jgi:DNA-binding PadR family transcriptional regulator